MPASSEPVRTARQSKTSQRPINEKMNGTATVKSVRPPKNVPQNWFRLGYLIHDVSRMRRTVFNERFKHEGITRSQWWVLSNIYRDGDGGILSSELARLMDVGKVTMAGLIDRLETGGYIYRRADKSDRRAKHIFITESGHRLILRMRAIVENLNKEVCEGLTQDDIEETELNLIRIKDNLREMIAAESLVISDLKED